MSWLHGLRHRVRTLLFPRSYAQDLEDEFRFHLELDAMQEHDPDRARRRFGNRTYYMEETRHMTWLRSLDTVRQDLGYAWRGVTRAPGFTTLVVITLALGIGVNAATFTVLDELYLRPPAGIEEPATVRRLWFEHFNTGDGVPFTAQSLSYPMYRAIAVVAPDSASIAVLSKGRLRMGRTRTAPLVRGAYASANVFPVLGLRTAFGRVYTAEEDRLGEGARVAVVSHAFWRNHLGGDSAALGKSIEVGRNEFTVIGVLAPEFKGIDLQPLDVLLPMGAKPGEAARVRQGDTWVMGPWWESHNSYEYSAVARFDPSQVAAFEQQATQRLRAMNREWRPQRPDTLMNVYTGAIIEARGPGAPAQELTIATRLGGVALIVLLVAFANVTNLMLARAVRRRREIAIRLALGISRRRLIRLLTLETVVMAVIAAIAAMLAGWWGGALLRSLLMPDLEVPGVALHWRVALFTGVIALIAGIAAGLIPAFQASRPQLTTALKAGAREGEQHRSRLRRGLVVAQAALSVVLLVGAGLFVRSLHNVRGLDIGYDASRLLFGSVAFDEGAAPPNPLVDTRLAEIAARLERRPGVEAIARTNVEPMRGFSVVQWYSGPDSAGSFSGGQGPTMTAVTSEFFRTAGIRILRGRGFTPARTDGALNEVVVNEAMASLVWPGREAVGQCMQFRTREGPCTTVVGIVENVRHSSVLEDEPRPQYYLPLGSSAASSWSGSRLMVRTQAEAAAAVAAEMNATLREAFPGAYPNVTPMTEYLEPEYRPWRLGATLFTAFGLLALLVAVVGIYSTVSYGVSQRTHEFGVRIALGARLGDVLRQVVGEGLRTVALGVAAGVLLAVAAARLVEALLYDVQPRDPVVLLLVSASLLAVAVVAALLPAWRAARVDPVTALRVE